MHQYSVVVSKWGWSIKENYSGKLISGTFEETYLPQSVLSLQELLSDNVVCITSTVNIPAESSFNQWFDHRCLNS